MNELIYNEIVSSPGFELEFAVGTTFSLDAEVFLALSLSFARLGETIDSDLNAHPIRLLEGLRQATNKVAIFCNRGGLQPPIRKNPLYAMLDNCVFEVASNREPLANFHPKLWIIKERSLENPDFRQIKLIVLSRNLTKDTSLDVAVALTAPLGVKNTPQLKRKHAPLQALLEELVFFANSDKRKRIKRLIRDIDTMGAFELDEKYVDYDFLPFHFGENLNPDINFREEMPGRKMMIVSPFIDKTETFISKGELLNTPIHWLNDYSHKEEKVLVTRLESLSPEIIHLYSCDNREVWVMSPLAEQNDIMPFNLHAKMYFSQGSRKGGTYLWLGSTNATHSGFYRNSEFLLRLTLKRGKHLFETFKAEFCDEKKQLCQRITSLPENMDPDKGANTLSIKVRRNLINPKNLSAEVDTLNEGYHVRIKAKKVKDIPGIIKIAPLQEPFNERELSQDTKECGLTVFQLSHLSEFYIISVIPLEGYDLEGVKMVIKIPTIGIPKERDERIFHSLIDTSDKFLSYIELMITDRPLELDTFLSGASEKDTPVTLGESQKTSAALYESLLRLAATNPEKLEDIWDLMRRVDSEIVPESFRQMAGIFKCCLKKLR